MQVNNRAKYPQHISSSCNGVAADKTIKTAANNKMHWLAGQFVDILRYLQIEMENPAIQTVLPHCSNINSDSNSNYMIANNNVDSMAFSTFSYSQSSHLHFKQSSQSSQSPSHMPFKPQLRFAVPNRLTYLPYNHEMFIDCELIALFVLLSPQIQKTIADKVSQKISCRILSDTSNLRVSADPKITVMDILNLIQMCFQP
jgi:hypothetical protein